jgi:hypothetical protein
MLYGNASPEVHWNNDTIISRRDRASTDVEYTWPKYGDILPAGDVAAVKYPYPDIP